MKAKIKSLFWKIVCTIGVWALLLTIIQGICNYFLVTRYAANKDIVQTNLIEKQTEKLIAEMKNFPKMDELQLKLLEKSIDKLEREIIKLDSKYDEILKKVTITEKGKIIEGIQRDTIKDLTPIIKITPILPYYNDLNHIIYNYSIENKGKYLAKVDTPQIYLATSEIQLDPTIEISKQRNKLSNQLLINKDYRLESLVKLGDISPGDVLPQKLVIYLPNHEKIPNKIYYSIIFIAKTDPSVIETVKNINKDEIKTKKTYVFSGSIIKPD